MSTSQTTKRTLEEAVQYHQSGDLEKAEALYTKVLELDPQQADALNLLGVIAHQAGNLDRALAWFDQAMAAAPKLATIPFNKANALKDSGRTKDARAAYEAALRIEPKYADALLNLGTLLQDTGDTVAAIATFNRLLEVTPDAAQAHYNIGKCHHLQGRLDQAQRALAKAIALDPTFADAHFAMANLLADRDSPESAISQIEIAIKLKPNWAEAISNWGNFLCTLNRHEDALVKYEQSLILDANNQNTRTNYGLALLTLGLLERGWSFYRSRIGSDAPYYKNLTASSRIWQGEDLSGARVLVSGEQGIGDQILFASMLEEFVDRADSVTLTCSRKLLPVFERSFSHLKNVEFLDDAIDIATDDYDLLTTFIDIGHQLRPDISAFPQAKPYLFADDFRANSMRQSLMKKFDSPRQLIGVCWASANPQIGTDKSIPLEQWSPILRCDNLQFISLQTGPPAKDTHRLRDQGLPAPYSDPDLDLTNDLPTTLSYIWSLDRVITCSTTIAHIAGALGKPTWVLLPLGRGRLWYWFKGLDQSPWYSAVNLYGQQKPGDWSSLMSEIAEDISKSLSRSAKAN